MTPDGITDRVVAIVAAHAGLDARTVARVVVQRCSPRTDAVAQAIVSSLLAVSSRAGRVVFGDAVAEKAAELGATLVVERRERGTR